MNTKQDRCGAVPVREKLAIDTNFALTTSCKPAKAGLEQSRQEMIRFLKYRLGVIIALGFGTAGSVFGQDETFYEYLVPHFTTPVIEPGIDGLDATAREELKGLLSDVIWHPEVNGKTRGAAMALDYAMGSRREVIEADFYFRFAQSEGSEGKSFFPGETEETVSTLADQVGALLLRVPDSIIVPFLRDIHSALFGNDRFSLANWVVAFAAEEGGREISAAVIDFEEPGGVAVEIGGDGFQRRQSLITGLLVVVLDGSNYAGSASQMNATVVQGDPQQRTRVMFNQAVGEMMDSGLRKAAAYIDRHEWEMPMGHRVEISFESQYSPKDGDSASVACALLLNSLLKGEEIDAGFAVTGALEIDGVVGAVGGIDGKIRGATGRNCTHMAIPSVNEEVLLDMIVTDGIQPMAGIQIFTIDSFAAAHALSVPQAERAEDLKEAMELFSTVQQVLAGGSGLRALQNGQVQERLRQVVELAPNHASAKVLLLSALGRVPEQLSLRGSLTAIDRAALPLLQGLDNDGFRGSSGAFETDEFATATSQLLRLRPKLDARARATADAIAGFSELFSILRSSPPNSDSGKRDLAEKIDRAANLVQARYDELLQEVREETEEEEEEN